MDLDNKIIICPNSMEKLFLKIRNDNPMLDFTLIDLRTLQKSLFGDYEEDAVKYLIHSTNYSLKSIKTYLDYITRGLNLDNLLDILNVKTLLDNNKLLKYQTFIKGWFKNKQVIVIGYLEDNVELKHVLNVLGVNSTDVSYENPKSVVNLIGDSMIKVNKLDKQGNVIPNQFVIPNYAFDSIGDEVRYVFNLILDEQNTKLINSEPLTKKCIICNPSDYSITLDAYSKAYGIKLYYQNKDSIKNQKLVKEILHRIESDPAFIINEFVDESIIKLEYGGEDFVNELKTLIQFYELDKIVDRDRKYNIFSELVESLKLSGKHYENEIIISSSISFDPYVEYYVLGASDKSLPSLKKNDDLLDDLVKVNNGLNSSLLVNAEETKLADAFLWLSSVKWVSYHEYKGKDKMYPTVLTTKKKQPKPHGFDYSSEVTNAYYSKAKDIKAKYNEDLPDLNYEDSLKGKMPEQYNSAFGEVTSLDKNMSITLSFSSIEEYNECPFKYYISHILSVGEFEENYAAIFGRFAHEIFEHIAKKETFDDVFNKMYAKYEPELKSAKDKTLMLVNKERLRTAWDQLKTRCFGSGLVNVSSHMHEYSRRYEIKPNLFLTGSIDSFVCLNNPNPNDAAIIIMDYKTGDFDVGNEVKYASGLKLQLLTYCYMLSRDKTYENNPIAGIYFVPIRSKELNPNGKNYLDSYKLNGLTFDSAPNVYTPFVDGSDWIKNYVKKDGTQKGNSNIYLHFVDEAITKVDQEIRNANFPINPTTLVDNVCKYCEFKDICYKRSAIALLSKAEEGEE